MTTRRPKGWLSFPFSPWGRPDGRDFFLCDRQAVSRWRNEIWSEAVFENLTNKAYGADEPCPSQSR